MGESLAIKVIVDVSQVNTGMSGVTSTIDSATARIKASFGSLANAPEGIRNALTVLQNASRMSAEAVSDATTAISALGSTSSSASPKVASVGAAAARTAAQMTSMERAMALASGRMAGMLAGAGMMGGALGRVGAASATLGPLLAVAFPVIGAIALVDVIDHLLDKFDEMIAKPDLVKIAWNDLALKMDSDVRHAQEQIDALSEKYVGLTQGPLAELQAKLGNIRLSFDGVDAAATGAFAAIEKGLKEADVSRFNPVNWLNALRDVPFGVKDIEPLARKINIALQDALLTQDPAKIQQALTSGLTELTKEQTSTVAALNKAEKSWDQAAIEAYQNRLQAINAIIGALQNLQKLQDDAKAKEAAEKKDNRAEQAKELTKEQERATEAGVAYFKAMEHAKEQAQSLADSVKKLADEQAEFGAKAAAEQSVTNAKDTGQRSDAEREFQQDRLNDQRAAAVASVEIEQDRVRELARQGLISASQELAQLNALETQKRQIEMAYLDQRINTILARLTSDDAAMYAADLKEWSKLLSEKEKAEEKFLKDRQKNIKDAEDQESKSWTALTNRINSAFDGLIQSLAHGNESIGRAFGKMLDKMLADTLSFLAKDAEKWAENKAKHLAEKSSELSTLLGLDTANKAAKQATDSVAAASQVSQQAGVAGAAAFASIMAAVPFPANVAAAPAGMAAAIASVMGNLTLTSAAGGIENVPNDMIAQIHKGESVIPESYASGLRSLVAGGGSGHTFTQENHFHGAGGRDLSGQLARSGKQLVKLAMRELRKKNR